MKKITLALSVFLFSQYSMAERSTQIRLINASTNQAEISFLPGNHTLQNVMTPRGEEKIISLENATPLLQKGAPDLQKLSTSIIIPDYGTPELTITASDYY